MDINEEKVKALLDAAYSAAKLIKRLRRRGLLDVAAHESDDD